MMRNLSIVLFVVAAACGGKSKSTPTTTADHGGEHGMGMSPDAMKAMMAKMPPEMSAFHDVMAPNWHAAHGDKRMADTCASVPTLTTDGAALAAAKLPEGGDAAKWSAGGTALTAAVADLKTKCDAKDGAAFEASFEGVHKAFHGMMEAAGMMHDMHDEHGEHGEGEGHQMGEHMGDHHDMAPDHKM
jgi:hypothetical protein